jgi:hypothetical protein
MDAYPHLVHHVHGTLAEVDGDRASSRSYCSEWGRDTSGQDVHMSGVYSDDLVRTPSGWRFSGRRWDFLYRGRGAAVGKFYAFPAELQGRPV